MRGATLSTNGLTDEHRRALEDLAGRWRERAAAPDRAAAERAVGEIYRGLGLEPPAVVWCDSPLAGMLAARDARSGPALTDALGDLGLHKRLQGPDLPHDLSAGALTTAEALVPAPAWRSHRVGDRFRTQAGTGEEWWTVRQEAREPATPALVLAALLLRDTGAVPAVEGLDALAVLGPTVGWWWAYERTAILTPPPVEVRTDARGRLHSADGPAVRFADGFSVHAWHAHPVPPSLISPGWSARDIAGSSDAEVKARANAELGDGAVRDFGVADQRRCAAERLGWARMAADLDLSPVAEAPEHALYDLPEPVFGLPSRAVVGTDGTARLVPTDLDDPAAAARWLTGPAEEPGLLRRAREEGEVEGLLAAFDVYTDLAEQYGDDDPHVEEVHLIGGQRLEPFAYEGAGGTYFLCGEGPRRPVLYADSEGGSRVLGRDLTEALELLAAERVRDSGPDEPDGVDPRPAARALGLTPPDTPGLYEERLAAARAMSAALTLVMTEEGNGYARR